MSTGSSQPASSARSASHAGSWYTADGGALRAELTGWLDAAATSCGTARAIIAPHAGYSYSGPTAAYAYKHVATEGIRRVFLLGPSHNMHSPKCLLSGCTTYDTPLGSIPVDGATYDELAATGLFDEMSLAVDEREHSLEMHLPFIAHVMKKPYALVPIMVGALSEAAEARYGALLAKYLLDPATLFVVSSDFCHWGQRFGFTYHEPRHGEIADSVEALDRQGMALIEGQDAPGFAAYLRTCKNTICGRHPIAVLLHALAACKADAAHVCKFVRYAQSSRARAAADSSVSYASAVVWAA